LVLPAGRQVPHCFYMKVTAFCSLIIVVVFVSCKNNSAAKKADFKKGTYGYDSAFLAKYDSTFVELRDESGSARLLISPNWQGRVMTSTSTGAEGSSYGWINYELLASGKKKKQFNPVGGEERFWLGPEGGQFSIYFAAGDSFNINKWQVPAAIDTIPFKAQVGSGAQAMFGAEATIKNYSGFEFSFFIERRVRLLRTPETESILGAKIPQGVQVVAFETLNRIENKGNKTWAKETGLLSIWLLGMYTPTDSTTVIIPFQPGENSKSLINSTYFGEIPADRLTIKDSVLFFRCDGKYRSKIGLPPSIAKPIAASFDFSRNILTFIIYPVSEGGMYVNSKWEIQKDPFSGDVVNSYNDGPLANGDQLGPFYELESSSAAKPVKRGESISYLQTTVHFEGDFEGLRELAKKVLGVDLNELNK
jgi:hypothetical protein